MLASAIGLSQEEHSISDIYDRRLSRRRKAFSLFIICFADAVNSAGEMGPNFLFRTGMQSASLSLGLLKKPSG